jgi:transcriptional regulator with XRE-family HTH domain
MTDTHRHAAQMMLTFLRNTAKDKGITHNQIAERTGFQVSNVTRMLGGKYPPNLDNFLKLAEAIGVRLELHTDTADTSTAKIRNIDVPKFLFAPDQDRHELFIMHTHYPACLIQVVQHLPAKLLVVENYDTAVDYTDILQQANEFYKQYVIDNSDNLN